MMDSPRASISTPPPYQRHSSATFADLESNATTIQLQPARKSCAATITTTPITSTPPPPSKSKQITITSPSQTFHNLLVLSPPPTRRSKTRVDESLELTPRRRRRNAGAGAAAASPKNRRGRRRVEKEETRDGVDEDENNAKGVRKRKQNPMKKKKQELEEDLGLALVVSSTSVSAAAVNHSFAGTDDGDASGWEGLWERFVDLIMWKNVAKSALCFGFGSMFFLSSSFTRDVNFSMMTVMFHLGILILGLAFFKDSVPQRQQLECRSFQLTEDDILRAAHVILPMANSAIAKAQMIFSGDPSMTLKVLPIMLFGAKYGNLITVWRLLATGFFTSFTIPKLYRCYSQQIQRRVESVRDWILEAWKSCPRKKFVVGTAVTMCWNMVSVKTRILAAFISIVVLRYYHQKHRDEETNCEMDIAQEEQPDAG